MYIRTFEFHPSNSTGIPHKACLPEMQRQVIGTGNSTGVLSLSSQ